MVFTSKSGQNFRSGSPGVLQNFKNWLETVIVWREFWDYQVKLKLFVLKSGQNFRSGSPVVLQNFKSWLEIVMVRNSFEKSDLEKSVHFRKTVVQSSFFSKLWSFSIQNQLTSKQCQLMSYWKVPQFWKKKSMVQLCVKMNGLQWGHAKVL